MRIVSLACSNTEIVCSLGCEDQLVGVDDHSDFPSDVVSRLPKVGPDLEIDIEGVAALEPDLVLATLTVPGHEKVVARLEAAGLPFLAPEPVSLADVYRDVRAIGAAIDAGARAAAVATEMERAMSSRTGETLKSGRRPSLLIQWWPKPVIAPGKQSWVHDLIELAGGCNPLGAEEIKSRPVPDDEVAALAPDTFVLSWCGVEPDKVRPDVVYANPAWQELAAIRDRRVYRVPEALLGRPSPRLVDGFRALCRVVDSVD